MDKLGVDTLLAREAKLARDPQAAMAEGFLRGRRGQVTPVTWVTVIVKAVSRPTINEIAHRAGVSKSAVSYALNGRAGVSPTTRARIMAVADDLSWRPQYAARALAARRVGAIGLVLYRPARQFGLESALMEFISGVQEVISPLNIPLAFRVAASAEEEQATYRSWAMRHFVDGVLLTSLVSADPRPALVRDLGLPAVVVGPQPDDQSVALWTADDEVIAEVVRYLVALGHRRIALVAGNERHLETQVRTKALVEQMAALGLEPAAIVSTDYSPEQGSQATRSLLSQAIRPTAIIYGSDVMAAAGVSVAAEMNVSIPDDLSIVAWNSSLLSQLTRPPLTSTSFNVHDYSMAVAKVLLELMNGGQPASGVLSRGSLTVRGSTAGAPVSAQIQ